jgi:hypothetical protein
MPKAIVPMAVSANPGLFRSVRAAKRRSVQRLAMGALTGSDGGGSRECEYDAWSRTSVAG